MEAISGSSFRAVGTVTNQGAILGTKYYGVLLTLRGSVTNLSSGTITGGRFGVESDGYAYVANSGAITGERGIYLFGGEVANQNGGMIPGMVVGKGFGIVTNLGEISEEVDLQHGGEVDNQISGTIDCGPNFAGVYINGFTGTVTNAGTIRAPWPGFGSLIRYGVQLMDGGNVTNQSFATVHGRYVGVFITSHGGTVTNAGAISAYSGNGIWFTGAGEVDNQSTGTIGGGFNGIEMGGAGGTVTNTGAVSGDISGISLVSGAVANQSSGTIMGGKSGIYLSGAAGSVTNAGEITGGASGVFLKAGGGVTNRSTGTISASTGVYGYLTTAASVTNAGLMLGTGRYGVWLRGGGGVTNQSTGTNALVSGTTITNAGGLTILDGSLSDAGTVIDDGGIQDDAPTLTIGTLSGTRQVLIGDASTLTVSGSVAAGQTIAFAGNGLLALAPAKFSGQINGLGEGGRIALTGITDATSAGIVNGNTLAITQSGGPTIDLTLDPTQSYAGVVFPIATLGGIEFVDASAEAGPTVIDQGETESLTGDAASILAAVSGGVGGITVTGTDSLLTTTADAFVVGDTGLGDLTIEAAGTVNAQSGLLIANTAGASGSSVGASGAGSDLTVTGVLTVGEAGSGSLSLSDGAAVTAGALVVAAAATGDGDVSLAGTGTTLDVAGALTLGGAAAGELSILGGARMTVGGGVVGSSESAPGNLDIEGTGLPSTAEL